MSIKYEGTYLLEVFSSPYPPIFRSGKATKSARARHCLHSSIMSFLCHMSESLVKVAEEEHHPVGLTCPVVGG